jgi:hypothetical protein
MPVLVNKSWIPEVAPSLAQAPSSGKDLKVPPTEKNKQQKLVSFHLSVKFSKF